MTIHKYTEEEIAEYVWCISDPIPFMLKCMIQHPLQGAILFEPYLHQLDLIDHFQANQFSMVNSARQMGTSTTLCAYLLWQATMQADQTIVVASSKLIGALELSDRISFMIDHLPPHLKPNLLRDTKHIREFDNGSRIIFRAISDSAMRGMHVNTLVLDNAAYANEKNIEGMWTASYPCIAVGQTSRVIIVSSPGEVGNFFYRHWKEPNSLFAKIALPYYHHPDRTQEWADRFVNYMGMEKFNVEFMCLFPGEGDFHMPPD